MILEDSATFHPKKCSRTMFAAPEDMKRYNMHVDMPEQRGSGFAISAQTLINKIIGPRIAWQGNEVHDF